ncbi:MAG: hypothetical protein ACYTEL_19615 [Planctomycetota bacterium]|jgi:hypothetical protein
MPTKRRIIIIKLDEQSRLAIKECLSSAYFVFTEIDEGEISSLPQQADLAILCALDTLTEMEEFCAKLRSRIGHYVPIMVCAGRYTYPVIKPLLGNVIQSMAITPFDAQEFRRELDELDLGF